MIPPGVNPLLEVFQTKSMEAIQKIKKELEENPDYYKDNNLSKFLCITHDADHLVELGCLIVSALEATGQPVSFQLPGTIVEREDG